MFWKALNIGGIRSHQHSPCPPTNSDCPPTGKFNRQSASPAELGMSLRGQEAGWVPFVCPLGGQRLIGQSRPLSVLWGSQQAPSMPRTAPCPTSEPAAPPVGHSEGRWGSERAPSPAPGALIAALIAAQQSPSPYYYD